MLFRIIEVHLSELLIVGSNFEWDHFQLGQSWSHLQYLE